MTAEEIKILDAAIDRMSWNEINAFNAELRKGQSIYEDGGGFFIRAIRRLFGSTQGYDEVVTYQEAARAMVAAAKKREAEHGR